MNIANLVNSGWTSSGKKGERAKWKKNQETVRLNYWVNEMNVKEGGVDWTKLPRNATEVVDDGGGHREVVTLRSLKCPAGERSEPLRKQENFDEHG